MGGVPAHLVRVFFDTNVIVAGLVSEGLCHEIVETHLPVHAAILFRRLWEELLEKLREKFGLAGASCRCWPCIAGTPLGWSLRR